MIEAEERDGILRLRVPDAARSSAKADRFARELCEHCRLVEERDDQLRGVLLAGAADVFCISMPVSVGDLDFATVDYKKCDATAWVTLNRPEVLNAYNVQMRDDLAEVFAAIRDDAEVRVVVVRGAGRAFCAGADLTEFGTAPSPTVARRVRFARDVWGLVDGLSVPTIAAIHGYAIGSGFELALFCDLRIAAEGTEFAFPEARYGMIPAAGATVTLRRVAGLGSALDLLLTSRRIDAREALRIGAISGVVPQTQLDGEVTRLVNHLLALDDRALAAIKTSVKHGYDLTLEQALRFEAATAARLRAT